jgi:hypothetical protein
MRGGVQASKSVLCCAVLRYAVLCWKCDPFMHNEAHTLAFACQQRPNMLCAL